MARFASISTSRRILSARREGTKSASFAFTFLNLKKRWDFDEQRDELIF
jgi:hypothetical protein